MNKSIQGDFQICISVPLSHPSKRLNTCLRLITEKVDQGAKSVKK